MMKHMFKMALLMAMFVLCTQFAAATAVLSISDGINTVIAVDSGNTGVITINQTLGNWLVNVTTGISKPILGSATAPQMDLNSVNVTNISAVTGGILTIWFSDTNFGPLPASPFLSTLGGTTNGSVLYQTYLSTSNTANQLTTPSTALVGTLLTSQFFNTTPFAGTATSGNPGNLSFPYSLTQVAVITHTGPAQSSSFNGTLTTVPEPSTVLLLGSGILAVGLFFGRKRNK